MLYGMALCSFAALLLELALTRLFSVVLFYHFAFLAISIALLGLGAGGVFAHLRKDRLARFETRALVSRLCSVNALIVPVVLVIVLRIPVSLEISTANFLRLTAIYLASAVPFFVTGLEFSVVFAREASHVSPLYAADLAGGALACLAIVPLLNWLGGPNTVFFTGVCMAVAGTIWATDRKARRSAAGRALFILVLIAVNYSGNLFDIVYAKGGFRDSAWVEFARWNAISRVEVDPQGKGKAIVIDADASTYLMNVDPKHWQGGWEKNLMSAPPALANVLRPHGDFAIIGPGGGVDVLRALANGSPSVTGIEINPIIANTIMRGRYADYTFHLYEQPEVHIHVTDGRSFVRNARQQFDVVQMTLVDTWASTAAGAFALSENSLYTVEAFREYFEHLKPDGMIAITRWEFQQPREALRVVSVAMQALHEMGVANPAGNFIVVSEGHLDADGIPVVVLAKRSAFTAGGGGPGTATPGGPSQIVSAVRSIRSGFGCRQHAGALFRQRRIFHPTDPGERSPNVCGALPVRRVSRHRQCSVFLFHAEARPDSASQGAAARHRLEESIWAWPCWGWCWPFRFWPCWCFWCFRWRWGREASSRVRCACSTSSRSGWDTFWWRSPSSSASSCSWAIRSMP